MQKRTSKALKSKNTGEDAVSPVVGVMLLLVVTVIIAAVVATFASGLVTTQQTVPTLAADVKIVSADSYVAAGAVGKFEMNVIAVSEDIPTKDLKLVTKYTVTNRTDSTKKVSGGATVFGKTKNTNYSSYEYNSPIGYGPGVQGTALNSGAFKENQWFGYYALTEGTYMQNFGAYQYQGNVYGDDYKDPEPVTDTKSYYYPKLIAGGNTFTENVILSMYDTTDALDAILGTAWTNLKPGDTVDVTIIHVPTNGVLYTNTVTVE